MSLLLISPPMSLSEKQLQTGIAYFTTLMQIQRRLDIEAAYKKKVEGKEPARQDEPLSQKQDELTS